LYKMILFRPKERPKINITIMKRYIIYTFFLIIIAQASYAQELTTEEAKKRLLELRARKAQIEKEIQAIREPDKVILTEIKDGEIIKTVKVKEPTAGSIAETQ